MRLFHFCHSVFVCMQIFILLWLGNDCRAQDQTFMAVVPDFPSDKHVAAWPRLTTVNRKSGLLSGVLNNGVAKFRLSGDWISEHEKDTFRIFIIPKIKVFNDDPAHELTCSAMSEELTMQQLLKHSAPAEDPRSNMQSKEEKAEAIAKAYRLNVAWHRFLKNQTILLRDANGDVLESKGWGIEANVSGPMWKEWLKYKPGFSYFINGPEKQTKPLSFRVYSGLEYFFAMDSEYADKPYDSPHIAADDLAKLKQWEPQCPLARIHFRLLDAKTKQVPSVFDPTKFRDRTFLMASPAPDTPANGMEQIYIATDGTATCLTGAMNQFSKWGKIYFHAIYRETLRKDKQGWELVPFFKPVTTFHKFDPQKKVHNVDVLVEPVGSDSALVAETTLAVTDKASGKAIADVAVYTLGHLHQQIAAKEPLPLKAGTHKLLFYAEGYRLLEQEVTVHAKGKHVETVILEPLPAPVTLAFNGPADAPADKLQLKFRYDNYPFLGTLKLTRVNWKDGASSVPEALERNIYPKLTMENGCGEMPVAIDGRQPFTLCANAMPKPKPGMRSGSQELPLLVFRHPKGAPECQRAELKMPPCVKWKGKIDLKAANADGVIVIWTRKLDGIPDAPVAGATKTDDGECHAFLEPGQTYDRCMTLIGKDHKGQDACRALPPYTVPADAKELPEETLTPGPAGSGVPVRNKIGGWMF